MGGVSRRHATPSAPSAPGEHVGRPVELGAPSWTDDGRSWDGRRLCVLVDGDVRRHQTALLAEADVVVEALDDCTPGSPEVGGMRVLSDASRARPAAAGSVRLARGRVQSWRADDGTRLVLLTGPVTRPRLEEP